jgi:hypothetical protein
MLKLEAVRPTNFLEKPIKFCKNCCIHTFLKQNFFGPKNGIFQKRRFLAIFINVKIFQNVVKYPKKVNFGVQRIWINNLSALELYFDLPWRFYISQPRGQRRSRNFMNRWPKCFFIHQMLQKGPVTK